MRLLVFVYEQGAHAFNKVGAGHTMARHRVFQIQDGFQRPIATTLH